MKNGEKTHCPAGHPYAVENTYHYADGRRHCKICRSKHKQDSLYGKDYKRDDQLASQGNACAICGITGLTWTTSFNKGWHTDHNHALPGTHRGVLCATCNLALGKLEPHMDKVVAYLAKYAAEQRASTEGCDIECSGQERLPHEKDFEHTPVGHSSVDDSITPL